MPEPAPGPAHPGPKRPTFLVRLINGFVALAMVAVVGAAVLLAAVWLERKTEITLPTPTGSFAVGRAIYVWADDLHSDRLAPVPGTKRELLVWIWYPAAAGPPAAIMDDYLPAPERAAGKRANNTPLIFRLLTRDLSKVYAHSAHNLDVSPHLRSYPVVIMRAGASAGVINYTSLAEDLASHGYVVVGFDAPYRTNVMVFPGGRVITRTPENNPELCLGRQDQERCANRLLAAWTADIAFVLDRLEQLNATSASGKFTGRLEMTRIGVFGHSLGGATALQFCHDF